MFSFFKYIKTSCCLIVLFTLLTGVLYPLIITGFAQLFFPWQANGSLLSRQGVTIGSALIGQSFIEPHYFWSRPSATTPFAYNALNSSGSNLAPDNPDFLKIVQERVNQIHRAMPANLTPIPVDLITASASGLDPDISLQAALFQMNRVARDRQIEADVVLQLIEQQTQTRTLGFLGEPRVNVLQLNLALDSLSSTH